MDNSVESNIKTGSSSFPGGYAYFQFISIERLIQFKRALNLDKYKKNDIFGVSTKLLIEIENDVS